MNEQTRSSERGGIKQSDIGPGETSWPDGHHHTHTCGFHRDNNTFFHAHKRSKTLYKYKGDVLVKRGANERNWSALSFFFPSLLPYQFDGVTIRHFLPLQSEPSASRAVCVCVCSRCSVAAGWREREKTLHVPLTCLASSSSISGGRMRSDRIHEDKRIKERARLSLLDG